eukprot:TRINITY_DN13064_c0_g1_i1.p1 TRINITY_DN13064_c0_g1~~TRINITY_DN13064_c0_g1_i1.p1  ORF type:complete len:108 (+),score=14.33 TRINITY_DN13064_c0_g1_i1:2-325(+)
MIKFWVMKLDLMQNGFPCYNVSLWNWHIGIGRFDVEVTYQNSEWICSDFLEQVLQICLYLTPIEISKIQNENTFKEQEGGHYTGLTVNYGIGDIHEGGEIDKFFKQS